MKWQAFLKNASIYLLRTEKGNKENSHRPAEALDKLLKSLGIVRVKRYPSKK